MQVLLTFIPPCIPPPVFIKVTVNIPAPFSLLSHAHLILLPVCDLHPAVYSPVHPGLLSPDHLSTSLLASIILSTSFPLAWCLASPTHAPLSSAYLVLPSCLLTHLSRLLPPTCLSSISPCHTGYLLSSIVCTPVPPAHLLDPQTFLTFYLLPVCYSKVCCLLSRLLPSSSFCCPLSALLSAPPPPPHAVYCIRFNARVCRLPGYKAIEKKHVISNKYKTAIFK